MGQLKDVAMGVTLSCGGGADKRDNDKSGGVVLTKTKEDEEMRVPRMKLMSMIAVGSAFLSIAAQASLYTPVTNTPGGIDPRIQFYGSSTPSNGVVTLNWSGCLGPYEAETSTNLVTWTPVGVVTHVFSRALQSMSLPTNLPSGAGIYYRIAGPEPQYRGSTQCGYCHTQIASDWLWTPHASAFSALSDPGVPAGSSTNSACLPCHTVGYGFGLSTGFVDTNTTPTRMNVQCENCHGPASGHAGAQNTPAVTLDSKLCGGCHNGSDPANHSVFQDWETAGHAEVLEDVTMALTNSDLATSQGRMGNCGFCHSGAVRLALLKSAGALPSGQEAAEIAQTCVVCHDPHNEHLENGGYHLRNPMSSTNAYSFATSQTGQPAYGASAATNYAVAYSNFTVQYKPAVQICAQCHNGRGAAYTSNSRPPHHSPQYNMLLGNLGVTTNTIPVPSTNSTAYQSPHAIVVSNQCAHCHMKKDVSGLHAEHKFDPDISTNTCGPCHADPVTLVDTVQADISNRLYGVVGQLRTWASTCASASLYKYESNAWEFTTMGTLSSASSYTNVGPNSTEQRLIPVNIQKARFNAYLVYHDQSLGVHNAQYARYLLGVASNYVNATIAAAGTLDANLSGISPATATVYADGVTNKTITVQARDASGKNMTGGGAAIAFTLTGVGTLSNTNDNLNGTYTALWTAPAAAGAGKATIKATLNGTLVGSTVVATQSLITVVGPTSPTNSTVTPSTTTVYTDPADGVTSRVVTVQMRDSNRNNRFSNGGEVVVFSALLGTVGPASYTSNGLFAATYYAPAAPGSGIDVVTATLNGTNVGGATSSSTSCVVTITGPADASHSTLTPATATNTANGVSSQTITVQARDVNNRNRTTGGSTVVFSATAGSMGPTLDKTNGTYTAVWTAPSFSWSTSNAVISATLGGQPVGTAVSASNCVISLTAPWH